MPQQSFLHSAALALAASLWTRSSEDGVSVSMMGDLVHDNDAGPEGDAVVFMGKSHLSLLGVVGMVSS